MVHFDAHSDTNDRYFGDNKYTHGTPFRRAVEEGVLDPKRTIQIGIRGSIYNVGDMEFAEKVGHPRRLHGGVHEARRRQDDQGGAPHRRQGPDLCQLRRRRPRSRLRAGHGHAGDRGFDDAGGAAHPRGLRGWISSAATSWRCRRPSIPAATRRWWAPPSCSRSCACWPMRWRAAARATAGQAKR